MTISALPCCTLSNAASKSISSICSSRPSFSAMALAVSMSMPSNSPASVVISYGGKAALVAMVSLPASTVVSSAAALVEAASEEAALLAVEEAVLEAEPPQAVRARAAAVRPAAARKLRRLIFFIFKHSSVDCIIFHFPGTMRFIVSSRNRISICCTNKKVKCCAKNRNK